MVTLHDDPPSEADVVVCGPDRDHEGAVSFDPAKPEEVVEKIRARIAKPSRRPIFVVGAAGGCGATSLALHLAAVSGGCAVEASGHDLRRRLNLGSAKSWAPALEDEPVELCALPLAPGFRALLAPSEVLLPDVRSIIDSSLSVFDHVVVDVPGGSLDALVDRDVAIGVLVLTPTRPAAERAREVLAAQTSIRWATVTNRLGPGSGLTRSAIETLLQRRLTLELPCSAGLRDAEDEGRLLTSQLSPWLWQVKRLWRALATA